MILNEGERIRLASKKDASELLEIYKPYVLETAITFEVEVPSEEDFAGRIETTLKNYPYLVAEDHGEIVGYAYAGRFKGQAAYDWSVETSIYVKKGYHGLGIGSALYEVLEEILREQNITNVNACIASPRGQDPYLTDQSLSFHTWKGYSLVGRFHSCANKFDRWYDMVWMEKMIREHEQVKPFIPFSELQTLFLTSSPTGNLDGSYITDGYDHRNGFADQLFHYWRENARCLMITAFPDDKGANAGMREYFEKQTIRTGLGISCFDLWDSDFPNLSREEVQAYDVILLGGGHVPTQMAFFKRIGLKEKIAGFSGLIIGISAGSMNCAETVYAQPEEPGEGVDQAYVRFFPGLGLTDLQISPHYQMVKDNILDGLRLFPDIIEPDSTGHCFYVLEDGCYIKYSGGVRRSYGECRRLKDGRMEVIGERNL